MSNASKNLSKQEFDKVYLLFKSFRKCKTKLSIAMDDYEDISIKIIKAFDAIAPYEKYSGGNVLEFSFMMQDIRNDITLDNIEKELLNMDTLCGDSNNDYINYLLKNGDGLTEENAKAFVGVLATAERYGNEETLKHFQYIY